MTDREIKKFALDILHADSEDEVIEILKKAGYWDNCTAWRRYGDKEGNWSQIGNQQSSPEAALVEKVVNSIDSRLMSQCLTRGINPVSSKAPQSIREARARFFGDGRGTGDEAGTLVNWSPLKRIRESREITIAATGRRGKKMCLTISDRGEGQSAQRLPDTILSLNAENKQRIRFVQGKFNMGGSGALRFCGEKGIQLVISRRNPALVELDKTNDPTANNWAVTVVRREEPTDKVGASVHSEFTYLAPIEHENNPRKGGVLNFESGTMPIMPIQNDAYKKEVDFGTAIKLIEYKEVSRSHVLRKDGLLYALERLMPEIALPICLHECRDYKDNKESSFDTLAGLVVRLEESQADKLESGFPQAAVICEGSMKMTAKIYAFKESNAESYLKKEGVIFQINGQAHGSFQKRIFTSKEVKLPRLKDSLLVLIDCSELSAVQRENLFMASRDRLSDVDISGKIKEQVKEILKSNKSLRKLQQERKAKDVEGRLSEEKPLEEVLEKVLRRSPVLWKLIGEGQRLTKPFPTENTGGSEFIGKPHPTFFEVKYAHPDRTYRRKCEEGRSCRIKFRTDAENEYFSRPTDRGTHKLEIMDRADFTVDSESFALENGDANLNFALPSKAKVGDQFIIRTTVSDRTLVEPFVSLIELTVVSKQRSSSNPSNSKNKFSLPNCIPVQTKDELWVRHDFTPETACHVQTDPSDDKGVDVHTFYINVDNTALKTEMKHSYQDARVLEAKFIYGNLLLGLAMLHADKNASAKDGENGENAVSVQDQIRKVTKAVSPVLIPMIDSDLDESEF